MSQETKRVLQIIHNLRRAGAQEVVRTLSEYLREEDCQVVVASLLDGPIRHDLEALGINVAVLGHSRRYRFTQLPHSLLEIWQMRQWLAELVTEHQIEVAQTHLLDALDFLVLSLRLDTPLKQVYWTIHNVNFLPNVADDSEQKLKDRLYLGLYRRMTRLATGVIGVSSEVSQAFKTQVGGVDENVFTIANGVDMRRFQVQVDGAALRVELGLPADSRLLLTVGRLTKQKGQWHLIDAAVRVVNAYPSAHILIVGTGELDEPLKALARSAGLAENIHFLGQRSDIPRLLAACEIFVLPSLWEGLSIALLEAMAAGKPIVTTAVSGSNEVLQHGQTGHLIPPGDSSALAEALRHTLADPEAARRMGLAAQAYVEANYSARKQAHAHAELYRTT